MKTVLVTGSNGFIGNGFCKYMLENTDWNIIALDKTFKNAIFNNRILNINFDLRDKIEIKEPLELDYVVHFAAEKNVTKSYEDISPYIKTNIKGTVNLLEWLRTKKIKKMVNFSTAAVLGANKGMLTHEQCPYDPVSPYGGSKAAQEIMCITYKNAFKIPVVNVRIDTPFGPSQPEDNVIPMIIKNIINNNPVILYGNNVPFTAGYCSRNWIFTETIYKGLINILETRQNIPVCHLEGNNFSIATIFGYIRSILNKEFNKIEFFNVNENTETSDQHLHYSLSSIYDPIGKVDLEEFKEQIAETVEWYKSYYGK